MDLSLSYQLSIADYTDEVIKAQFVKMATTLIDVVKMALKFPDGQAYHIYDLQLKPFTTQVNKQGYMAIYPLSIVVQF